MRDSKENDEFRYCSDWIHELESKEHWTLYWKQQELIQSYANKNDKILEVGIGTGFTAAYLRHKGFDVTTADIDKEKNPDIHTNIVTAELDADFDIILAFEIFEHLPFKYLESTLSLLKRNCRKCLIFSVPEFYQSFISFSLRLPIIRRFSFNIPRPRFLPEPKLAEYHHWEVNSQRQSRLKELKIIFSNIEMIVDHHELFLDRHFFVLKSGH